MTPGVFNMCCPLFEEVAMGKHRSLPYKNGIRTEKAWNSEGAGSSRGLQLGNRSGLGNRLEPRSPSSVHVGNPCNEENMMKENTGRGKSEGGKHER